MVIAVVLVVVVVMHDTSVIGHDGQMSRRVPLATQLLAMQTAIVITVLAAAGVLAFTLQQREVRENYSARVLGIARSLAEQEAVNVAYASADPSAELQPLAELVRRAAGAEFVVFTDTDGIRYAHPDPAKIGQRVSTDPSVALGGAEFVGTEEGTLGVSLRAKVPVRAGSGNVVGQVSVGILESELSADLEGIIPTLVIWLAGAAFVGVAGAWGVTHLVRRRMHGLEPEQIVELLQASDAMLHGIREGVVAVDDRGRLAWINDQAIRLLSLPEDPTHRPAEEVLDPDQLMPMVRGPRTISGRLVLVGERVLVVDCTPARVDGKDVGRVLVMRDRTEVVEALRALEGQRTITDALRAQAHEFSNNLHVVAGLIDTGRTAQAVDFIERVGGGSGADGGVSFADLDDAALTALLLAKTVTSREKGVTVRVDADSVVGEGVGDDVLTIVANLLDNAVDAGGVGASIDVLVRQDSVGVRVVVSDDGPGVPVEQRRHIFDVGVSTKATTDDGDAHGIGLALIARIVTRRGGSVAVTERSGGGAVFTVHLPPEPTGPAARHTEAVR